MIEKTSIIVGPKMGAGAVPPSYEIIISIVLWSQATL